MSALIAALFGDHATAERVRTKLVSDGFPTDRVELTSTHEPGQAALGPADRPGDQLEDYFRQFFDRDDERGNVQTFVDAVRHGQAAIIVHPRGDLETRRAQQILRSASPAEVREHDLANQSMERAASPEKESVVSKLMPGEKPPH
ncbi:MAG TPA: hypothetical protein VGO53_07925 [Steroidobacteraceae bacterium]|jgi:hypothetical protein|nr:hypothetical protein [Steroidobacteraceae bacterium]